VAVACAFGLYTVSAPAAQADVRALKLHNLHTKEKAEIVFKRNGRYDQAGLKKLNVFLRDWRRNEPTKMDPRLLDLVWEAYRATGSREYIHVVSAYRSPATNNMLRGRSKGVAQKSQHMLGKAMDFFIPGVPLKKLRDIGLKMQGGGVGYYPTSGSPFVHMDVGNVRHWPGISRQELASVFPNGKTLHVPSDGKPLPGYEQALAAYKSRSAAGSPAIALAGPTTSGSGKSGKSGGLLAALFGGGADEEEDNGVAVAAAPAPKKPVATAASKPAAGARNNLPGIAVISPRRRSSQRCRCAAFPCPARHRVPRRMWAFRHPIRFRSVWPMSARCRLRRFVRRLKMCPSHRRVASRHLRWHPATLRRQRFRCRASARRWRLRPTMHRRFWHWHPTTRSRPPTRWRWCRAPVRVTRLRPCWKKQAARNIRLRQFPLRVRPSPIPRVSMPLLHLRAPQPSGNRPIRLAQSAET
jgi:uncharacterized protein YcbK (DUF882 family)